MQFTIIINQVRALEWGLSASEAMLMSFLSDLQWADELVGRGCRVFRRIAKSKIISEMPWITQSEDTVYRLLRKLEKLKLIEQDRIDGELAIRVTEKGLLWMPKNESAGDVSGESENFPGHEEDNEPEYFPNSDECPSGDIKNGENSEEIPKKLGKISQETPEKNPTYQYTSNQNTKINNSNNSSPSSNGNFSAITPDWFPSADVIELIRQSNPGVSDAEITEVRNRFVVYWLERGEKRRSFGSIFCRRFKSDLAEIRRAPAVGRSTRDVSLGERLTDTSWAGRSTRDVSLSENLTDRSWADGG